MECKHETKYLMGDKDGIVCRNCGARFKSFLEIEKLVSVPAEKPKKSRKRKEGE